VGDDDCLVDDLSHAHMRRNVDVWVLVIFSLYNCPCYDFVMYPFDCIQLLPMPTTLHMNLPPINATWSRSLNSPDVLAFVN